MSLNDKANNFNHFEAVQFFNTLIYLLHTSNSGIEVPFQSGELIRYVPYLRAIEYVKVFAE